MYKILIIEDDIKISTILQAELEKWDYDAKVVTEFRTITEQVRDYKPHLILLDINLPSYDGFYWCNQIRQFSKTPIIFISSRHANMDIVMAMNMGGDDYIQKPFSLDVILAKVTALIRRTYDYGDHKNPLLEAMNVFLNTDDYTVTYNNASKELTKNEYRILYELIKNKGQVLTRHYLISKLWDDENFIDDNTLTVNVNRVRKKLDELGATDIIKTKRGEGYII